MQLSYLIKMFRQTGLPVEFMNEFDALDTGGLLRPGLFAFDVRNVFRPNQKVSCRSQGYIMLNLN